MSALLVWMNTEEAKLFHVEAASIFAERVQHSDPADENQFFQRLCDKLKKAQFKILLLMGPNLDVQRFCNYLEKNQSDLFAKVVGVEKVDKMPDSEILSVGQKYLQKYYLVNAI